MAALREVRGVVSGRAPLAVGRAAEPAHLEDGTARAPGQAGDVDGTGEVGGERPGDERDVRRHRFARRGGLGADLGRWIGLEVEELRQQLGRRDAVDGGVVELRHHAHVSVREALDDVHLPQRSCPVELPFGHVGHVRGQLGGAARRGERGASDVVAEIEVTVVGPVGVAEAQRHRHQAAPEHGGHGQARPDEVPHLLEGVAPGHGGGVEDGRHRDVHVEAGCLHVKEAGVQTGQLLHADPSRTG